MLGVVGEVGDGTSFTVVAPNRVVGSFIVVVGVVEDFVGIGVVVRDVVSEGFAMTVVGVTVGGLVVILAAVVIEEFMVTAAISGDLVVVVPILRSSVMTVPVFTGFFSVLRRGTVTCDVFTGTPISELGLLLGAVVELEVAPPDFDTLSLTATVETFTEVPTKDKQSETLKHFLPC